MTTTDQIALAKELAAKDARIAALEEALEASGCRACGEGNREGMGWDGPGTTCISPYHAMRRAALAYTPNTASASENVEEK